MIVLGWLENKKEEKSMEWGLGSWITSAVKTSRHITNKYIDGNQRLVASVWTPPPQLLASLLI